LVLLELQIVVFENKHSRFVVVRAAVVGRRENRNYVGERVFAAPLVHLEAVMLHLVASENTEQFISLQQFFNWLFAEVVRALALGVVNVVELGSFFVVDGVRPNQVTEYALQGDLLKSI
jgi:hypothetical protein